MSLFIKCVLTSSGEILEVGFSLLLVVNRTRLLICVLLVLFDLEIVFFIYLSVSLPLNPILSLYISVYKCHEVLEPKVKDLLVVVKILSLILLVRNLTSISLLLLTFE